MATVSSGLLTTGEDVVQGVLGAQALLVHVGDDARLGRQQHLAKK